MWYEKNENENTDEIIIEILEKEMHEKVSVNDTDRSHPLEKTNKSGVDLVL